MYSRGVLALGSFVNVVKRGAEGNESSGKVDMPHWAWLILLLDVIIFLPVILLLEYSLKQLFPIFAMIEDENPPAYEPLALAPDADEAPEPATGDIPISGSKPTDGAPKPVSSSLRSVSRLLRSQGGFRAYFRGLACMAAQFCMTAFLTGVFSAVLPFGFSSVATLLASLAMVQYSTAWVHIVISKPKAGHFWTRLSPYKRVFDATWRPVMMYWAALELSYWLPFIFAPILGIDIPTFDNSGDDTPAPAPPRPTEALSALVLIFVTMSLSLFFVVPAHVILVRVQASLLPVEDDPIVPFDRSFQGRVESEVVSGRGWVTPTDAWATFSRTAWKRLIILYVKIYVVSWALATLFALVVFGEFSVIMAYAGKERSGDL